MKLKLPFFIVVPLIIFFITSCNPDEEPMVMEQDNTLNLDNLDSLNFTFVWSIPFTTGESVGGIFSFGMSSSDELGRIYFSHREKTAGTNVSSERLIYFDTNDNSTKSVHHPSADGAASKNIEIIDERLISTSGLEVNTFSASDLSNTNSITQAGVGIFSKTASFDYNKEYYVVGGDLTNIYSDKIMRWDEDSETRIEVASLPGPRFWHDAERVGDRVYVIGGGESSTGNDEKNTILIFNLATNSFENSLQLPNALSAARAIAYGKYILIAGVFNDWSESYFGILNTETSLIKEIPVTVGSSTIIQPAISGLEILNDQVYALVNFGFNQRQLHVANLE